MAKKVFMSTEAMEVFREEVGPVFEVKEGSNLVGRLTVSTGGLRWAPPYNKGEPHFISWESLDDVMRKQERR